VEYQDFHFVNVIGMNGFQIDISAWYGSGGGLDGIELFENDIFAYAINTFNEPTCAGIQTASTATITGPWVVTPSQQSSSEYLSASLSASQSASVVFLPDIKQSGNYSVNMYTPGCIQDNTCTTRGRINITGVMSTGTTENGFYTEIFQTNNYDKYDQIYFGYIEAGSDSFRPSVTLSPAPGQSTANLSIVAQRVGFTLISSSGGLNSLFEYDPTQAEVDTSTFANSTFDQAGASLPDGAGVNALQTSGGTTYVGGNFTTSTFSNIFAVSSSGTTSSQWKRPQRPSYDNVSQWLATLRRRQLLKYRHRRKYRPKQCSSLRHLKEQLECTRCRCEWIGNEYRSSFDEHLYQPTGNCHNPNRRLRSDSCFWK
jgi:hypothetical protein